MSKFQHILLGFVAGGIVLWTWSLISDGTLLPSLTRIIVLIVAFIVVIGLIIMFAKVVYKTIRDSNSWVWAFMSFVLGAMTFIAVAFVVDWGVGASIRSLPGWSSLPEGNLFVAGGSDGWTYLVLFILLSTTLLWPRLLSKLKRTGGPKPPRSPFRRSKSHHDQNDNILTDPADIADILTAR